MSRRSVTPLDHFANAISQAKQKIDRANRHAKEVDDILASYVDSDFCQITENADRGQSQHCYSVEAKDLPPDLPLAIGDCFHNLSTALDYVSSGIARALLGTETRITFPSHETHAALEDAFKAPKPGKNPSAYRQIVEACPIFEYIILQEAKSYKGGGLSAWEVRKADNMDKHNLLIPTVNIAALNHVLIVDTERNNEIKLRQVTIGPGGKLDAVKMIGGTPQIRNYGQASFSINFPDTAEFYAGEPVVPTLEQCVQNIRMVIKIFEAKVGPTLTTT
jgi:hypothetical protein